MRSLALIAAFAVAAACGNIGRRAKKGEAEVQLGRIAKLLKVRFAQDGQFPAMSIPLPAATCCEQRDPASGTHRCMPARGEWDAWSAIDFSVDEPRYFQYAIETTPTTFRARAVSDIDCDLETSEFVLEGVVTDGQVKTTLTRPAKVD